MSYSAIPPTTSATLPYVNVMDYGAVADDFVGNTGPATDNTAKFNAALTAAGNGTVTFVPPGVYRINGDITVPAFQFLHGGGNFGTQLRVTTNSQTQALINLNEGSALRNIAIIYDQPDPGHPPNYALLRQYKPAIYLDSTPWGCIVENVRISFAWDGIKTPNGGRSYLRNIEMSMFNRGIDIDGSLDTFRIENLHIWPFNLSGNWTDAFQLPFTNAAGHSVALYLGRVDGLQVHGMMCINGTAIDAHAGTSGSPNVYISDSIFDTYAAVRWSSGNCSFDNCFFSSGGTEWDHNPPSTYHYANRNSLIVTGGQVLASNCHFYGLATGGMVQQNGGNSVQLSNCRFTWTGGGLSGDQPMIVQGTGPIQVNGCYFDRNASSTFTLPCIDLRDDRAVVSNNIVTNKAAPPANFIKSPTDVDNVISGNIHPGWTMNLPADPLTMRLYGNESGTRSALPFGGQQTNLSAPASTASTTGVMMGLGATANVTATATGRMYFSIQGFMTNNTSGLAVIVSLYYGPGTSPPINGATPTGTQLGQFEQGHVAVANGDLPFAVSGIVGGLTAGTQYWYDLKVSVPGGGTGSLHALSATAFELP